MHAAVSSSARLDRLLALVELDPANMRLRKETVREACGAGHWDAARILIEVGLQTCPEEAGLLGLRAFTHLQAQRYGDAEQDLLAALAQGLDEAALHYNLAFAQFMQQRYPEALERLESPATVEAIPLALLLRARCRHHLHQSVEALADCRAYLQIAPDDAGAHGLLGLLLYEQSCNDEAKAHAEAALHQDPRQLEAMLTMASIEADSQEYGAARDSFDSLLQAHPQCGRGWLGLALLELMHMRMDAAKQDIELAASYMPDHIGTWHVLAWVAIMRGDVAGAADAFDRALQLDRNFSETHGGLAVIAALQGREDGARASIKRALRLDAKSMSAQYALMLLLRRAGQPDEAQMLLDTFLARRVAQGNVQYRDLVATHMKYLGMRGEHAGRVRSH